MERGYFTDSHRKTAHSLVSSGKHIDTPQAITEFHIAKHIPPSVPVILVCGTDAACGKRTTALELYNASLATGIIAGFIATSQSGILSGCDAGIVMDNIPTDFVAGEIEQLVQEVIKKGKELIFVEGRGAVLHHAYSTLTLGILHGAQPKFIVLNHPVYRKTRNSFPEIPIPDPKEEITALEQLSPGTKVIALALNSKGGSDYQEQCKKYAEQTGLLTVDVIADKTGAKRLLDKILIELENE